MKLSKKIIEELYSRYDELDKVQEEASELLKQAKENKEAKVNITRDGKEVEVTEKDLWDEVRFMGMACEAYKILNKKYPKVFEASEKQNELARELQAWTVENLGIDYRAIKLSDIFRVVEAIIDYKNEKK